MKLWTILVQGDDSTWLEAAWEDEQTAENRSGWEAEVDRVRKLAYENRYEMRIAVVKINGRPIYDSFLPPVARGVAAS